MTEAIPLTEIQSSHLAAVGYDAAGKRLRVRFKNGAVYDYAGVPAAVYADFRAAASAGVYLRERIIPRFPAKKLTGEGA